LIAPVKVAIFPLVKKDGLPEFARKMQDILKFDMQTVYDEKDAVGRRYRRQDAKGTPFCITVDYDSLNDHAVTIRERDSMAQHRIPVGEVRAWLLARLDIRQVLDV